MTTFLLVCFVLILLGILIFVEAEAYRLRIVNECLEFDNANLLKALKRIEAECTGRSK